MGIDAGKPGGLVARNMRPRHFSEYTAQPMKFVAGSHCNNLHSPIAKAAHGAVSRMTVAHWHGPQRRTLNFI
jgi:hypothetical protein